MGKMFEIFCGGARMWADENDRLTILKTNSLEPEHDDPDVIVIECWHGKKYDVEEDW